MPRFECKDTGMNCNWVGEAPTVEELMQKIAEHAKHDHGMEEIPPEMVEQIKKLIKD